MLDINSDFALSAAITFREISVCSYIREGSQSSYANYWSQIQPTSGYGDTVVKPEPKIGSTQGGGGS